MEAGKSPYWWTRDRGISISTVEVDTGEHIVLGNWDIFVFSAIVTCSRRVHWGNISVLLGDAAVNISS